MYHKGAFVLSYVPLGTFCCSVYFYTILPIYLHIYQSVLLTSLSLYINKYCSIKYILLVLFPFTHISHVCFVAAVNC